VRTNDDVPMALTTFARTTWLAGLARETSPRWRHRREQCNESRYVHHVVPHPSACSYMIRTPQGALRAWPLANTLGGIAIHNQSFCAVRIMLRRIRL
jgi:hypothetical protein